MTARDGYDVFFCVGVCVLFVSEDTLFKVCFWFLLCCSAHFFVVSLGL